jgi:hypothetical protein
MEVRVEKKKRAKKNKINQSFTTKKKKLTAVLCWLTEGQELDEKKVLILWTCLYQCFTVVTCLVFFFSTNCFAHFLWPKKLWNFWDFFLLL